MSKYALRSNQIKAIEALISGQHQIEAAKVAGVNRRTIQRWLAEDVRFRQALAEAETAALAEAARALAAHAFKAVEKLVEIIDNPESNPAEQRRAASDLLRIVNPFREPVSIEQRLNELEKTINEKNNPGQT